MTTLEMGFIPGDNDGEFTFLLAHALNQRGVGLLNGSSYILKVRLENLRSDNIGYRHDRNRDGQILSQLTTSEARYWESAHVEIIDASTERVLAGPVEIREYIDSDFIPEQGPADSLSFSLGLLTTRHRAQSEALSALKQKLAAIVSSWVISTIHNLE